MTNFCPNCGRKVEQKEKFCTGCGTGLTTAHSRNNLNKKDLVYGKRPGLSTKNILNLTLLVVFASSLFIYFATSKTKEEKIISEQPEVIGSVKYPAAGYNMQPITASVVNGNIVFPLDEVLTKKFVRFVYSGNNIEVPLLAYLNEDGKLVTSISMCEPCNSTTFHIKGDELVCNSCGSTWDLNNLNAISGSCGKYPPDPIPSKVAGNEIQIDEYLVTSWTRRN